ncbi:ABC transporter permease subunit [Halobacteriales archaeon Cl-PHB]
MFELTRYDVERRVLGIGVLSALLAVLALFTVAFFPSVESSAGELQAYIENLPPAFRTMFGVESFATVEGFLATEFYAFGWVILLGLYFAYVAGGLIAGEVEDHRMDMLLSLPVSRRRIALERFLGIVPTMLVVNVVGFVFVFVGLFVIGESGSLNDFAMVHLLSLPYLLACGGLGLVLSVLTASEDRAKRGALGLVFGLFLLESLSATTDYDWVGAVSPTRYYDPTGVLVMGEYDLTGALILFVAATVLVGLAVELFRRMDVQ